MTNPSSMNNANQQPTGQPSAQSNAQSTGQPNTQSTGQPNARYSYPYYQPSQASYPYYSYPTQGTQAPTGQQVGGQSMLPTEESYIENILRLNRGKTATVYMTFENNREWNAKIFKGVVEAAGRDHIVLSDMKTGIRYVLPMIYLDYITFEGEIQYSYPFNGMASYPSR
ncbi:spore coat protein GerQ [Jeotgalibacillus marinus]|uniref:Spore coat protein GerQ n=1 Tax=Jeotgalibacillus marinus TaxID=86667 RepID=A0ABV3Q0P5_9BACL